MSETAYTEDKYWHNYPDGIGEHFWFVARNRIIEAELKKFRRADDVLLDIGCGRGHSVSHLRKRGFECFGVEVGHPQVLEDAAPYIHTGKDAFDLSESLRHRVTVVLLLDVIEHLPDPEAFLRRCRESLPHCRMILATVPARRELWTNYDDYFGHFRRYDLPMLAAQGRAAGLKLAHARYFFHLLCLPVLACKLLRIRRRVELKPPRSGLFHRLLAWCFTREVTVLPGILPGTSLLGVFEALDSRP
jgi:2-polyprenyl-3-methyl-5-hydroxy-6-metoxy-1,4-benzoquinol methylase